MQIAVCDDDMRMVRQMKSWLEAYPVTELEVTTFYDGRELVQCKKQFEIIFLDIDMKYLNGLDAAKILRKKDKQVKIIYISAYSEFYHRAFSVHAFAYLLKPVTVEQIYEQLKEVRAYEPKETQGSMLRFATINGVEFVDTLSIYYFEYMNRKIYMKTDHGEYILKDKITQVEQDMGQYGFAMPHKSFVVNLYHVKSITGYDLHISNGDVIPLSQKKSPAFRKLLNQFLAESI